MAKRTTTSGMKIIVGLTIFVGGVWVYSLVLDMLNPKYDPPDTIGLAFMAVLSTLLGIIAASQRDGGRKDDEDDNGEGG